MDKKEKIMDGKARRAAKKIGLDIKKSRGRMSMDNFGDYMLRDPYRNWIIMGEKFDLTAEDIIELCSG